MVKVPVRPHAPEEKQELYRILNRDQCRDLRIPRPNYSPVRELSEGEWRRIRMLADATEAKEKRAEEKNKREQREHLENDYLRRKSEFDRMEAEEHFDPIEDEIRQEKAAEAEHLRSQLVNEQLENDDTVRFFNHCLNGALVRAVRDRQVFKSEQIKQLAEQEQFRIDNACQKDANLGFAIEQKIQEYRQGQNSRYGRLLKDQLKARAEERLMDKEANAVEGRAALNYARRMQRKELEDEVKEYNSKKQTTHRLLAENSKAQARKKESQLHKIRMDLALAQTLKDKNAELDRREAELKEARRQKNLEHALVLTQHKRAVDYKAIEDEKRAQRAIHQADRDWRKKELALALKQKREKQELKNVIEYQRELKIRKEAHEMEEERKIFNKTQEWLVSEAQKAEAKRIAHDELLRSDAVELRKQIEKKERERWESVQEKWSEGKNIRQSIKSHDDKVLSYMKDKMDKAEAANVPHGYMVDIMRHMTYTGHLPKAEKPTQKLRNIDHITTLIKHFE